MLKIQATVQYEDGRTVEVRVGPVTQVAFEREHNCGIGALADDARLSYMYWLAWHASRTGMDFDPWLETVAEIDVDVDEPDPTGPAPVAG